MGSRSKGVLAVALVGALAWLLYSELSGVSLISGTSLPSVPEPPAFGRLTELEAVASVSAAPLLGGTPQYDLGGRNLFQYGQMKPPPPSPEELERIRLIKQMVDDHGINLAGVQRLLAMAEVMQRIGPLLDESALSTGSGRRQLLNEMKRLNELLGL